MEMKQIKKLKEIKRTISNLREKRYEGLQILQSNDYWYRGRQRNIKQIFSWPSALLHVKLCIDCPPNYGS